jgi:hypothetical protein
VGRHGRSSFHPSDSCGLRVSGLGCRARVSRVTCQTMQEGCLRLVSPVIEMLQRLCFMRDALHRLLKTNGDGISRGQRFQRSILDGGTRFNKAILDGGR